MGVQLSAQGTVIKTAYEAEANAYTDTKNTKLTGIESGADVTDPTNVAAAGAVMGADKNVANGVAGLDASADISDSVIPGLANKYSISDDLLHSHDAEASTSSTGYVKLKTITINTLKLTPSTIRIKFDLKPDNYNAIYGRIYKNGDAVGTIRSTDDAGAYVTFSEDLEFAEGDALELYMATLSGTGRLKNFRVYGIATALTLKEAVENSDMGETTPFAATNS